MARKERKEDELDKVRNIFESNGTETSSHKRWETKKPKTREVKISFQLTRPINGSNANGEDLFGPDLLADG